MTTTHDKPRLLLVDFENVQQVELSGLDDSFRIIIFVGAGQKSVPIGLVASAQRLGSRVEWQKVAGEGRNALDFFIACHLGRVFDKSPRPECFVLSKDKGFDPLLRQLNADGLKCRRIASLLELGAQAPVLEEPKSRVTNRPEIRNQRPAESALRGPAGPTREHRERGQSGTESSYRRVAELLGKSDKRSRPRKRKTLSQYILSVFQKRISQPDVDRIIASLLANKMISEAHNIVTYHF
jgi:hypothetical protein